MSRGHGKQGNKQRDQFTVNWSLCCLLCCDFCFGYWPAPQTWP